jgi:hypothetical protein
VEIGQMIEKCELAWVADLLCTQRYDLSRSFPHPSVPGPKETQRKREVTKNGIEK